MIHPEMRWVVRCGFRWSGVSRPKENRVVFVDEGDEFVREAVVLAQLQILVDNLGVRLRGRDKLPNIDVFRTVPKTQGLLPARMRPKSLNEPNGLVYAQLQVHIGRVVPEGGFLDPACELVPPPGR